MQLDGVGMRQKGEPSSAAPAEAEALAVADAGATEQTKLVSSGKSTCISRICSIL